MLQAEQLLSPKSFKQAAQQVNIYTSDVTTKIYIYSHLLFSLLYFLHLMLLYIFISVTYL